VLLLLLLGLVVATGRSGVKRAAWPSWQANQRCVELVVLRRLRQ
jgi:hypothetical protein